MSLDVVVLAAGKGTRMKSALPKVLQPLARKPLLAHVMETVFRLPDNRMIVVYGHGGDVVMSAMTARFPQRTIGWAEQAEQKGTGHAVAQAIPHLQAGGRTLVLYGDVPLTSADTLSRFLDMVPADSVGLLTVRLVNPTGYGRILRNEAGEVQAIVEEKDATPEQRRIDEVNVGIMLIPNDRLCAWLPTLSSNNAQGEYYLTDIISMAVRDGVSIVPLCVTDPTEVEGVNDRKQLAALERAYQRIQALRLMEAGVTLADPQRIDVRGSITVGSDCFIDVNAVFEGSVTLGNNVEIGPNCVITDATIGDNTSIKANCVIEGAVIGEDCTIGPYARLRPGTVLHKQARVGNFVETKNATIGEHSKANHLTYLGDCELGRDVNVGAGTITCNYDGVNKFRTTIGDGAFIGSNSSLVAPIDIGAGATIGAGSTVAKKAEAGALTVARAKQVTLAGWKRPGKKQ